MNMLESTKHIDRRIWEYEVMMLEKVYVCLMFVCVDIIY